MENGKQEKKTKKQLAINHMATLFFTVKIKLQHTGFNCVLLLREL